MVKDNNKKNRAIKLYTQLHDLKNLIYYTIICLFLCYTTGLLGYLISIKKYILLIFFIILTISTSFGIDYFVVKKIKSNEIISIKRVFFPFKSALYYKYVLLNLIITFICIILTDTLFEIKNLESLVSLFFCIFIFIYMSIFRIYYIDGYKYISYIYIHKNIK